MPSNPSLSLEPASAGAPDDAPSWEITPSDIAVGVVVARGVAFFDLFVFGIACVLAFPHVFFPFADVRDGVFYGFLIFAVGFVAQPLGSLAFMSIQRHFGRPAKILIALFLLGTCTVGMALLPGWHSIGGYAIAALVVLRLGQGFAIGGSWTGLASLLMIKAPREHRGLYAALPQLAAPVGFIVAAGVFAYIWGMVTPDEFADWGWRFPFIAAFAINMGTLFAIFRLVASDEYAAEFRARDLEPTPASEMANEQGGALLLGAFAPLASYALMNLVTIFALGWVLLFTQHSLEHMLWVQIIGALVAIPCMLLSGVIADRLGRRTTLGLFAILIAVYSGWTALLLSGGNFDSYLFIVVGFALLGFSHAQASGVVAASFRPEYRYPGANLSSDLSWLIGAGFAPFVALWLAVFFGAGYVGLYLLSGAVCSLAALWISRKLGGLPDADPRMAA
jgi:MFS family permease